MITLTPEQISIVNDMCKSWLNDEQLVEFRIAFRNDCKRLLATTLPKPPEVLTGYTTEDLYNADPDCQHEVIIARGGGVKCRKCTGWFCY